MPRTVREWIGKTDDTPVPDRVKVRVWERGGRCCAGCGRPLTEGDRKICDHIKPLILGGANRETNLQTLGAACCAPEKDKCDMAAKSRVARKRSRSYGRKVARQPFRGWRRFDGTIRLNPKAQRGRW